MKATSPRHVKLVDADAGQEGGGCRAAIFIFALHIYCVNSRPYGGSYLSSLSSC
jgi:hypothetical protein